MTKLIISIIVSLAIILGLGIFETVVIEKRYAEFKEDLEKLIKNVKDRTISLAEFDTVYDKWKENKQTSELFLTHSDINEVNMRMSECKAFIENKDYDSAFMQLCVLVELAEYIPRMVTPALRNII